MKDKIKKLPITLCVITCNSGSIIKDMITKNKEFVDEVIVLVQESKDNTLEEAESVADLVVERKRKGTCDPDANWAFSLAKNEWILYLGDDEFISKDLAKSLKDLIKQSVDIYWFVRKNLVDGIDIFDISGRDMQPRLFRKGSLNFPDKIHTYPKPDPAAIVAYVDLEIIHKRTLEGLKKSNRARNIIADPEMLNTQENFIKNVERLLELKK